MDYETLETLVSGTTQLSNLTPLGVETLKSQLPHFHEDCQLRIALIRHIMAGILFNTVFDRFVFGLNRDSSDYFVYREPSICTKCLY